MSNNENYHAENYLSFLEEKMESKSDFINEFKYAYKYNNLTRSKNKGEMNMKELPKSRLTFKESMIESQYLATKTKEEKKQYKQLSVEDKREILKEYQSKPRKEVKFESEINKSDENLSKIYQRFSEIGVKDFLVQKRSERTTYDFKR